MDDEKCFFERKLDFIQHNILAQIYSVGIKHGLEMSECFDENEEIEEAVREEFANEFRIKLEVFKDIVDLVWNDDFEYVCEDCEEKLEASKLVDDLDNELKKKKG